MSGKAHARRRPQPPSPRTRNAGAHPSRRRPRRSSRSAPSEHCPAKAVTEGASSASSRWTTIPAGERRRRGKSQPAARRRRAEGLFAGARDERLRRQRKGDCQPSHRGGRYPAPVLHGDMLLCESEVLEKRGARRCRIAEPASARAGARLGRDARGGVQAAVARAAGSTGLRPRSNIAQIARFLGLAGANLFRNRPKH